MQRCGMQCNQNSNENQKPKGTTAPFRMPPTPTTPTHTPTQTDSLRTRVPSSVSGLSARLLLLGVLVIGFSCRLDCLLFSFCCPASSPLCSAYACCHYWHPAAAAQVDDLRRILMWFVMAATGPSAHRTYGGCHAAKKTDYTMRFTVRKCVCARVVGEGAKGALAGLIKFNVEF